MSHFINLLKGEKSNRSWKPVDHCDNIQCLSDYVILIFCSHCPTTWKNNWEAWCRWKKQHI